MRSKSIFPFDVCKPLTESSVYQGAVELSDNPKCGYWISKEILLCALKGLQKELEGFIDDYPVEPAEYDFGRRTAYVSALARLKIWFPILQSETLKTTDDGNAHLPQSNQTEDVRTSESLVGGSEHKEEDALPVHESHSDSLQTSNYDALDDFCHSLGEPDYDGENQIRMHWKELSEKVHVYLLSQPSSKASRSSEDEVSSEKGSRSSVGDAGELKTVEQVYPEVHAQQFQSKHAPRKGKCIVCCSKGYVKNLTLLEPCPECNKGGRE